VEIKSIIVNKSNNWQRNLAALSFSQFFYRASTRSLIPFLPLFIQDLGKISIGSTAIWSGWIFAAPYIVSFFATPFWGSFGDKFGRKLITLLAIFGFAAAHLLMGFSATLTQLLIFASLQEFLGGVYPSSISLIISITPKEKTTHALGYFQFASASGNVVGPVIGGIVADMFGYRQVLFLIAGVVAFTGIVIFLFVEEKNFAREEHQYHSLIKNLRYVLEKRTLIICGIFMLIYSLSVTTIRPSFTLFIKSLQLTSHNTSTVVGILLGIFGGASAISSALVGKISSRINLFTILLFTSLICAISFLFISATTSIIPIVAVLIICGFSLGLILPIVYTLISSNTESDRKAGVFGISSNFQVVGNLSAAIASGYLVSNFGLRFPFIAAGLLFLLFLPIYKFWLKEKSI